MPSYVAQRTTYNNPSNPVMDVMQGLQGVAGAVTQLGNLKARQQEMQNLQKYREESLKLQQQSLDAGIASGLFEVGMKLNDPTILQEAYKRMGYSEEASIHMSATTSDKIGENRAAQETLLYASRGKKKDPKTGKLFDISRNEALAMGGGILRANGGDVKETIALLGDEGPYWMQKIKNDFLQSYPMQLKRIDNLNINPVTKKWLKDTTKKHMEFFVDEELAFIPSEVVDEWQTSKAFIKYYEAGEDFNALNKKELDLIGAVPKKQLEEFDASIAEKRAGTKTEEVKADYYSKEVTDQDIFKAVVKIIEESEGDIKFTKENIKQLFEFMNIAKDPKKRDEWLKKQPEEGLSETKKTGLMSKVWEGVKNLFTGEPATAQQKNKIIDTLPEGAEKIDTEEDGSEIYVIKDEKGKVVRKFRVKK